MPSTSTEDELRAEKIRLMGEALGVAHFLLWKDLAWLNFEWQEYRVLFGTDPSRIDLMNSTARRFFWSLDRVLWQDILLSLSRLCDPPATKGQQNLTFRVLPPLVRPTIRARLESALDAYESEASFARDWRHRRYAHRDYDHAIDSEAHALQQASRAKVEAALAAAGELMNIVELEYHDSTTHYGRGSGSANGAYNLLYFLDAGLEADTKRRDAHELWRPRFK